MKTKPARPERSRRVRPERSRRACPEQTFPSPRLLERVGRGGLAIDYEVVPEQGDEQERAARAWLRHVEAGRIG